MKKIVVMLVMILSTIVYAKEVPIGKVLANLERVSELIAQNPKNCVYWNKPTKTPSIHDEFVNILGKYPDSPTLDKCIEVFADIDTVCDHPSIYK
jgi:hypothetical protein